MSIETHLSKHLLFILETIEYLVSRLDELYRQQQLPARNKSLIKIYDKNIDRLPTFHHELPTPPNLEALLQQLHHHRLALTAQPQEKPHPHDTPAPGRQLQLFMVREVKEMDLRMLAVQQQVRSLSSDVGELILLYKQSILA